MSEPTLEQIAAAQSCVGDGHFTCGTCDCIERRRTIADQIAVFLARREAALTASLASVTAERNEWRTKARTK